MHEVDEMEHTYRIAVSPRDFEGILKFHNCLCMLASTSSLLFSSLLLLLFFFIHVILLSYSKPLPFFGRSRGGLNSPINPFLLLLRGMHDQKE